MSIFYKANKEHIKFIFFSFLILFTVLFIHSNTYSFDFKIRLYDYLYTPWVFSYDYGFIRRALPGEILNILGIDPTYRNVRVVSVILLVILFSLFVRITYIFFKNLKIV